MAVVVELVVGVYNCISSTSSTSSCGSNKVKKKYCKNSTGNSIKAVVAGVIVVVGVVPIAAAVIKKY